jgi:uncharacterized protein YihD (DUF1040 family)
VRDPKRIKRILAAIEKEWKKAPDLRLGQLLLASVKARCPTLFYMEDDKLVRAIQESFKEARSVRTRKKKGRGS